MLGHTAPLIACNFHEFKQHGDTYFQETNGSTDLQSALSGHKCLMLLFLYGTFSTAEEPQAEIIINQSTRRLIEVESNFKKQSSDNDNI